MKTTKWIAAAIALSLSVGSVAQAQGWQRGDGARAEHRGDRGHGRGNERIGGREDHRRADRRQDYRQEQRREAMRERQRHQRGVARHDDRWDHRDPRWNQRWSRGAGPRHDLYRGGHLPREYRRHNYVVDNWRGHRLQRPPSGCHWVQAGSDYVLAAIATGVILSIIVNN